MGSYIFTERERRLLGRWLEGDERNPLAMRRG